MSLDLTVTDLFCGAGGSSLGAKAMGARVRMAANHWSLAIETHAENFPDTDHDCADVSQVDPRRYPTTDLLLASPECTHHSQARSKRHHPDLFNPEGDPAAERSRATMWCPIRFAEHHRYKIVVVENVVEILRWPPFDAWLAAMHSLGYRHRILSLNSMVAPGGDDHHRAPQSRDRVYVVFWLDGNPAPDLDFRPPALCDDHGVVDAIQVFKDPSKRAGRYRQQYLYRCPECSAVCAPLVSPALSAIDFDLPCPRIGDRAKPLAEATMRRIQVGLERYGPSLVQRSGHTYERPGSGYVRAWPLDGPAPTQTTETHHAVAMPGFFVKNYGGISEAQYRAHPLSDPLGAVTGSDSHGLVVPLRNGGEGGPSARTVLMPWPTQTGRQELALVVPMRTHGQARPAGEPTTTITTAHGGGQHLLLVPLRRNGQASPATDPAPTVTAAGNHHGLLMVKNYGDGSDPSMTKSLTGPFGTVTALDHHSLVSVPFLTAYYGNGGASPVTDPVPTVTTRDRHGLVEPAIDVEDCGFRMLEPHEIGRAMAFPDEYVVKGNKRDRVRQYGNAVTPPAMAWITQRCIDTLAAP